MSVPFISIQSDEDKQLQEELEMMVERLGVSTTTTRTAKPQVWFCFGHSGTIALYILFLFFFTVHKVLVWRVSHLHTLQVFGDYPYKTTFFVHLQCTPPRPLSLSLSQTPIHRRRTRLYTGLL